MLTIVLLAAGLAVAMLNWPEHAPHWAVFALAMMTAALCTAIHQWYRQRSNHRAEGA